VPSPTRNMSATWRTLGALCRELDWNRHRLLYELQNGLRYRTVPPGRAIDWHHSNVRRWLNVEASEVSFYEAREPDNGRGPLFIGPRRVTVGIEVLPPGARAEADVPSPSVDVPAASLAPRRPSDAAVEQCFRAIMKERPDDPPDEAWLLAEMKNRLGASPGRARVRSLWKEIAPQWKRPRGHPRNFNSAKKSAE
jgi:hypothetical protein